MPEQLLQAAQIGVGGFGGNTFRALRACPLVELRGLADADPAVLAAAAQEAACTGYADDRQLLVQSRPQAVFLAVPPARASQLVRLAARWGAHVWKEAPLARTLAEAVELCRTADAAGVKLAVGTQRRFMPGYRRARALIQRLGTVYLLQAHHLFNWGPVLGWRGDRAAGGGALLEVGWHLLDLTVWLLGLPETVYAVASTGQRTAPRHEGRGQRRARPPRAPAGTICPCTTRRTRWWP